MVYDRFRMINSKVRVCGVCVCVVVYLVIVARWMDEFTEGGWEELDPEDRGLVVAVLGRCLSMSSSELQ